VSDSPPYAPFAASQAPTAMVSSVDQLASAAGLRVLVAGGNAVDAAVAANAVLSVTLPNQCGLGGDLFALVHRSGEDPVALNASGRSGSGADPAALRADGHQDMPFQRHFASVTVPGCVDGWLALHERFGRLDLAAVLAPAIGYARHGFPASPFLARAVTGAAEDIRQEMGAGEGLASGQRIRRLDTARMLEAIARGGRSGFYLGEFGEALVRLGAGLFTEADMGEDNADWVTPLSIRAWGRDVWTIPPGSQGYLTLSAAWMADQVGLPEDPADPLWAHLLIEAARQAAYDRLDVLHEGANGAELLSPGRLGPRAARIDPERAGHLPPPAARGGTTYLCAVDGDGMAVSLMQSNAMGFGSELVAPGTGVFLHNRGLGFNLRDGHPAEYGPRRRPPHTLAPVLVTEAGRQLAAVLGTRGGDAQPQVVLQLLALLLNTGRDAAEAVAAGRWMLTRPGPAGTGFETWAAGGEVRVGLEGNAPAAWADGLAKRGHDVVVLGPFSHEFGHAQAIVRRAGGWEGAADPRSLAGAAIGF
jgi:gamma-glutamyltranspeptidase / glutathione hydrolase